LIDPHHTGVGLASEAGAACVAYGFEVLHVKRLVSICVEENSASRRVMEKLGFLLLEQIPFEELGITLWVHALDPK